LRFVPQREVSGNSGDWRGNGNYQFAMARIGLSVFTHCLQLGLVDLAAGLARDGQAINALGLAISAAKTRGDISILHGPKAKTGAIESLRRA
jgi:hypothetical protein